MLGVVKFLGYAGSLFWFLVLAAFVIALIAGPAEGWSPEHVEFDKIAIPCGLALSLSGLAVSAGMLRAKVWAYYGFVVSLSLIAVSTGLAAVFITQSWLTAAWAGSACGAVILVQRLLFGESVRIYFGLSFRRATCLRLLDG